MSTSSGSVRSSVVECSPPKRRISISPPQSPAKARNISKSRKSPSWDSPAHMSFSENKYSCSPTGSVEESELTGTSPTKILATKPELQLKLKDLSPYLDKFRSMTRSGRIVYNAKTIQSDICRKESISNNNYNDFDPYLTTLSNHNISNHKPVEDFTPHRSNRQSSCHSMSISESSCLSKSISESSCLSRSISESSCLSKSISESSCHSKSVSKSVESMSDEGYSDNEYVKRTSVPVTRRLVTPLRTSSGNLNRLNKKFEFGRTIAVLLLIINIAIIVFYLFSKDQNIKASI